MTGRSHLVQLLLTTLASVLAAYNALQTHALRVEVKLSMKEELERHQERDERLFASQPQHETLRERVKRMEELVYASHRSR